MPFTGPFEDRLAIRETLDAYADAVNQVDAKAWGSLWAEESMWSMPDYPEFGTVYGRANIVETWIAAMKQFPGVIFVATPGSIVVEGDQATVRSMTSAQRGSPVARRSPSAPIRPKSMMMLRA